MQYSDVSTKKGIIQLQEKLTSLGYGNISGSTDLLQEFTSYNNDTAESVWSKIFSVSNGWRFDDRNRSDLPQAVTDLVSGTFRYTLPETALTIDRIEIKDATGAWKRINPIKVEKSQVALGQLEQETGTPGGYILLGNTIELLGVPNYNSVGGLKVFFTRALIEFAYDDTTETPGFDIEHSIIAYGGVITWMSINQPGSASLPLYIKAFNEMMDEIEEYYAEKFKDNNPVVLTSKRENNE